VEARCWRSRGREGERGERERVEGGRDIWRERGRKGRRKIEEEEGFVRRVGGVNVMREEGGRGRKRRSSSKIIQAKDKLGKVRLGKRVRRCI